MMRSLRFGLVLAAAFGPLFILVDTGLPGAVANMLLLPSAIGAAVVARAAQRHLRRGIGRQLGQRRRRQRALQAASLDAPVAMPSAVVVTDRDDDG